MNFLNLSYFLVVAEELNITKAAERLFISQQSLSNHISRLEKYFDTQLFNRVPTLSLTYAGQCLVRTATQILDLKQQIITEIDDINNRMRGKLRLGISHTRGRVLLPEILPAFSSQHPLVELSVTEGNTIELEKKLMMSQIDLLIGFAPVNLAEVETIELLRERIFLVVPKSITAALFPKNVDIMCDVFSHGVDITAFRNSPFLMMYKGNRTRNIVDMYFEKVGITPNIILETENIETLLSLCLHGMGITVYPEMFVKHLSPFVDADLFKEVDFFPLNDPATMGSLIIGYRKDRYLSEIAKDFISSAKKICSNLM